MAANKYIALCWKRVIHIFINVADILWTEWKKMTHDFRKTPKELYRVLGNLLDFMEKANPNSGYVEI